MAMIPLVSGSLWYDWLENPPFHSMIPPFRCPIPALQKAKATMLAVEEPRLAGTKCQTWPGKSHEMEVLMCFNGETNHLYMLD